MGLTRREAFAAAAAAWLAVGSGRAPAMPPAPAVDQPMGLGFDLTPQGLRTPGVLQDYTVLREQPWGPRLIARATHVRFWVDWPFVQPDGAIALADPGNPGLRHLRALDDQVDAAVADGLDVILMPYRYPRWVNHTTRHFHGKSPEWRMPDSGHGPDSPWARFVEALWLRYSCRMACFEVVNEPNLQIWPQGGVAERVAEMVATVDAIARAHAEPVTCLAPSISDAESDRPFMITEQRPFTAQLLDALDRRGFEGGKRWVWSFHNYNDAELGGDRVSAMRERLAGRWRGRAAADGGPLVYATEGGVRLSGVRRRYGETFPPARQRAEQAAMLAAAIARYERTPGVGLFTQYTVTADPAYDCGLREADGSARPSFEAFVTSR
jgi:Cellulase (glycosyl hydrolase family 5)